MDFARTAEILGISEDRVKATYQDWLSSKRGDCNPRVDLRLIASLSGLSTASISYFLNGKRGSISPERSERLQKLFEHLRYIPSLAARKLRSKEKKSLAFISPLSGGPSPEFSLSLLRAVKEEAAKYGYFIDVFDVAEGEEKAFFESLPFLGMVDGVILSSLSVSDPMLAPLLDNKIPVVDLHGWHTMREAPVTCSFVPRNEVFSQLLDHLFGECGYRNPVLVSLPPRDNHTRKKKIEVFQDSLAQYGLPFDPLKSICYISQHTIQEGKRAFGAIRAAQPPLDVVVCLSDVIAMTILHEGRNAGFHLPVSGYDNLDLSGLFDITTIDQNLAETGKRAFQQLYIAIRFIQENGAFPPHEESVIELGFIRRTSSLRSNANQPTQGTHHDY